MDTLSLLALKDVYKTYHGLTNLHDKAVPAKALAGISITLSAGEIYGFVGLNGAGKTTAIKIAMGLIKADSGQVNFLGRKITPQDMKKIGFAPEKPAFYEFLDAIETLRYAGRLLGISFDMKRAQAVLESVKLWDDRKKPVKSYSKGMQQRLALACAMFHDPDLYILDEPCSGLDPLGRREVKNLLRSFKERGKTVFFSTHILADVSELCDKIGIIHEGRMLLESPLQELASQARDLEEAFISLIATKKLLCTNAS